MNSKNYNASITVFLSLIILLVSSIICVTIEKARIEGARAQCAAVTYMAEDSLFSNYSKELFEDYGLFVLWEGNTNIEDEINNYIEKNCNYKDEISLSIFDIYDIKSDNLEIVNKYYATQNDCEYIENQIFDYMKYKLGEDFVNKITEQSSELSQSSNVNEVNDELEQCYDELENVEKSVGNVALFTKNITDQNVNPIELINKMNLDLISINNMKSESIDKYFSEINETFDMVRDNYRIMENWINCTKENILSVRESTENYYFYLSNANTEISDIKNNVISKKDSYEEDVYNMLISEIENIQNGILDMNKDIYNIAGNKLAIDELSNFVSFYETNFYESIENFKIIGSYSITDIENWEEKIDQMLVETTKILSENLSNPCTKLNVKYDINKQEEKKNDYVDFIEKIKSGGIINLVVSEKVSTKAINKQGLPSNTSTNDMGKNWKKISESDNLIRQVLVGQYAFDFFSSYTDKDFGGSLDYEIEYILKGNSTDKKNLEEVINDLILIREGFNFVYLLGDNEKKEEAGLAANLIVGFTGMPILIKITQLLIIGAWAYAESIVDVKNLLNGIKVDIVKSKDSWNLSLAEMTKLNSKESDDRNGIKYEDYLRFLLLSENRATIVYRILDLIQLDLEKKYNTLFSFDDCVVMCRIKKIYKIKRLFTDINFVRNMIKSKDNQYLIEINQEYCY